jgi:hypothetical protein
VTSLPEVQFDPSLAETYYPNPERIKFAYPVTVPEWAITTVMTKWGSPETVVGPYYAIYDEREGNLLYVSDWQTWCNTNVPVPDKVHGWRKAHPVEAYLSTPAADCRLVTRLRNGHNETEIVLKSGQPVWLVRQRDGEVQHISPVTFSQAYLPQGILPPG